MKTQQLSFKGRAKLSVLENGIVVRETDWINNLILDQGLNNLSTVLIADLFRYCAVGTGVLVTQRTGTGNASMTNGDATITAASANFSADDVGRLVRWTSGADTDYEATIASFTDSTHVEATVVAPETISAGTFKVFYVEQTGLVTEAARTGDLSTATGENGTSTGATTPFPRTLKRTFLFPAETADITYKEVGFSNVETPGSNLNIRINLNPGSNILVQQNQRLRVTYLFVVVPAPNVTTGATVPIVDLDLMSSDKTGSVVIEKFATSVVNTSGITDSTAIDLEPSFEGFMALSEDTAALVPIVGSRRRVANVSYVALGFAADYVPGTFFRDFTGIFDLNDANGTTFRSLMLFEPDSGFSVYTFLFNSDQIKDSNHALTMTWRKSWRRNLNGL